MTLRKNRLDLKRLVEFQNQEELDDDWLTINLFRIGASSLLADVERQLEHLSTGSYSAENRHPIV